MYVFFPWKHFDVRFWQKMMQVCGFTVHNYMPKILGNAQTTLPLNQTVENRGVKFPRISCSEIWQCPSKKERKKSDRESDPSMPRAMAIGKATHYTCRGSCGDCIRKPHKPDATVFSLPPIPSALLICTWKGHSGRTGQGVGSPQHLVCIAPLSALHGCLL